jgi:hypothetical protein
MSGKGKPKGGMKDAATPPATEDPLEDAVEEALEHSYARRMLEIDGEAPKRDPKKGAPARKKPAGKRARKKPPAGSRGGAMDAFPESKSKPRQ